MDENIRSAIQNAIELQPTEFKNSIIDILNQKVDDYLSLEKMNMANSMMNPSDSEHVSNEDDFKQEEENVDEDL